MEPLTEMKLRVQPRGGRGRCWIVSAIKKKRNNQPFLVRKSSLCGNTYGISLGMLLSPYFYGYNIDTRVQDSPKVARCGSPGFLAARVPLENIQKTTGGDVPPLECPTRRTLSSFRFYMDKLAPWTSAGSPGSVQADLGLRSFYSKFRGGSLRERV